MSKLAVTTALTLVFAMASVGQVAAAGGGAVLSDPGAKEGRHFDAKGKMPSKFTIELQNGLRKSLPFDDRRDFEEAKRGFIAAPDYTQIMSDAGTVAWDMGSYDFLLMGKDFDSINPSLQRQAILNMAYGLYEVVPGRIYQVRGFDLANISFIRSDTGWIVFDPLTAKETARAALQFVNEKLGERPVVAVVYSHSHTDHYGGVRGVVDEADVASGKVPVIAPVGFMRHAVAENVYAGNAMNRRAMFQYGLLLPRSPFGHVDQSIGKNTAAGNTGLIAPTRLVEKPFETITVDGVTMVFQNTPGTEAPAEMNTYFPQFKAFWAAENITGTIHNIYTLRGALVRDALEWSKQINVALYEFGQEAEVMFASHSWPRFGNERIQEVMRTQRDTYANLNNQVLHLANRGVTINEIQNVYRLPDSLRTQWAAHSYHGSEEHNSRAVLNRYLGYWDGNPATLIPLSPRDSAPLYVEMMGGAGPILKKGQELFDTGRYLHAVEILNKLVYAQPGNEVAKNLLADTFEQIGYQKESPSLRNSFLAAAYELRNGMPAGLQVKTSGPDTIRAMSTDLWLDFLGVRLDAAEAAGLRTVINLVTPDNGEKFVVELSNSTLTNIKGRQAANPDLTITVNRTDLETVMAGTATLDDLVKAGKATLDGDRTVFDRMRGILVQFTPDFALVPGTVRAAPGQGPEGDPFAQQEPGDTSGG
ncbi:MBL fold metallo-hydrolase [Cereibacter sphaeroides]|uniref:alkyl/aryl-sulfatase n=1 Tax=Cereibacter sphaeroides TaxID=1063 RepID=UPI001F3A6D33|nr:alkyl sulfatase dimerization domain-containing protein [Cereibacter sphaeroides]MCE6961765.1 MBL fold metallo-hydrolase [Cereibacter sphaeroides]MCE6970540.1 MBL fold metallo-hydrolase [Cereibacter sphaeroides]MCE6971882.1 MBL fold metallo-hydrolase [Cereibacter sphaeroides]